MKLRYEPGDKIWHHEDAGGKVYIITMITRTGVDCTDEDTGEEWSFSQTEIEPHWETCQAAHWLRPRELSIPLPQPAG